MKDENSIPNSSISTSAASQAIRGSLDGPEDPSFRDPQSKPSLHPINDNDAGNNDSGGVSGDDSSRNSEVEEENSPQSGSSKLCRDVFWVLNRARLWCGKFVNNDRVQLTMVVLIAVNAIMMGVGTFDFVTENPEREERFELVDKIFLIIFTVELALQFLYHGLRLFLDGWLVFDFAIIVLSWAFAQAQIIRAFRIFRALRLVTRVEVMRNLVVALFSVMPRMAAIGLLLFLIFYIFAVMFTQLFKDMWEEEQTEYDYFSRLDRTFFTLFQIMTLDAWADVARDVMAVYPWAWVPFIAFVIISGFIVVNLIIAVICDAISALHEDERAKLHGTYESESEDIEDDEPDSEEQIKALETQIEELTRIQESTMMTLEYLTQQLRMVQLQQNQTDS